MIKPTNTRLLLIWSVLVIIIIGFGYCTRNFIVPFMYNNILGPRINFSNKVYDFGIIQNIDNNSCCFLFNNSGYKELEIYKIITTCDCITNNRPVGPISYNEYDSIIVELNSSISGYFSKEIIIASNSVTSPDQIYIMGISLTDSLASFFY